MSSGVVGSEGRPGRALRVAVLWTQLSGYVRAELEALVARGAEIVLFHETPSPHAPFELSAFRDGLTSYEWSGEPDEDEVERVLAEFEPDAMLVLSWHISAYRRCARRRRGRTLRVLCMDNQWWGTLKQRAGVLAAPWLIRPVYDAVMLPAETQAAFARRLGFRTEQMIWGFYTAETEVFEAVARRRGTELPPASFLYVGRLVPEKAIDVLVAGYARYRSTAVDPWPLIVAGTGPMSDLLESVEGVEWLGFVQPSELPSVFARAGCLVLPSRFEPWAVVVHEAACARLPVICTWVAGASTRLVLDGQSGAVISPDDPAALATALHRISGASDDVRRRMGEVSGLLSRQYSPDSWADNLLRRIAELRVATGLASRPPDRDTRRSRALR